MCEVLRSTFWDAYPYMVRDIEQASFIALDTEFSGLVLSERQKPSLFDDGQARYTKLRSSVSQFTLTQIGLSCFKEDSENNVYLVQTYNIPLLPVNFGPVDVNFMWQVSCMAFHCQHQFDFNKMAYEGVSFLNELQEDILRAHLEGSVWQEGLDRNIDEQCLQRCCSLVAQWEVTASEGETFQLTQLDFEALPPYLVVQEMRQRFSNVWAAIVDSEMVLLEYVSTTRKVKLEEEAGCAESERILNEKLGMTRIFRELVRCKKTIVGHNCLTDLLLIYEKFHKPLPCSFLQFKQSFSELFPVVYDTKHLCSLLRPNFRSTGFFENTSLSCLYESLNKDAAKFYYLYSPSVRHSEGFDRYVDKHCPHEAGYDAYMVGVVFLRMAHMLTMHGLKSSKTRPLKFEDYETTLLPAKNAVNVIRASINNAVLDGPDPPSQRPEMLFVRSHGNTALSTSALVKLFSAYGSVDIKIQNHNEALVAAGNFRCAKDILKAFRKHEYLHVSKYQMWKHSRTFRRLLWTGVLLSGSVCLFSLWSAFQSSKAA